MGELRESAGLSIRVLAARIGLPPATVGDYVSGRHLPSTAQLGSFTSILRELGITDDAALREWVAALGRARFASDGRMSRREAPYPGLASFGREDASAFFGRDELIEQVLGRVRTTRRSGSPVVAVVGASGSGKSSLLQAGVVPRVEQDGGTAAVLVPSSGLRLPDPLPDVLVVDQFEEIFTSVAAEDRHDAIAALMAVDPSVCVVLVGLRADFFPAALDEPLLVPALRAGPLLVTPMTRDELTAAIIEPASQVDVQVEPTLLERLLSDLAPTGAPAVAHDPGALPMLSHALLSTWSRASRNRLTVEDYLDAGGIHGAVQQSAEEVYAQLDPAEQQLTRRLFIRLVHIENELALTRRRVDRAELEALAPDEDLAGLIERWVESRLLTGDVDVLHISHEALLTAWPRLHEWVAEDRTGSLVHRRVTDAANLWDGSGRDETLLLAGGRLAAALEWRAEPDHEAALNERERALLDRSDEADRQRRTAERRSNRRLRQLLGAVVALLVVAAALVFVATRARDQAERDRNSASLARDQALSRVLAGDSDKQFPASPNVAAQLAVEALRITGTPEARTALLDRTAQIVPTRLATSPARPLQAVAVSTQSHLLAAAGLGGTIHLWRMDSDVPTPLPDLRPSGPGATLFALAFSTDGRTLFAAGDADTISVFDVAGTPGRQVGTLTKFRNTVFDLAVSSDGTQLAAASNDQTVCVWNLVSGHPTSVFGCALASRGGIGVRAVAYVPGRPLLVAGLGNGFVRVLHTDDPELTTASIERTSQQAITALAVGPGGHTVAVGSADDQVVLRSLSDAGALGDATPFAAAQSAINALTFRANGTRLLVASSDDAVREYSTTTGAVLSAVGQPQPVAALAAAGTTVVAASNDSYVTLWSPGGFLPKARAATVYDVGLSHDGRTLVVGTGTQENTVEIWHSDTGDSWVLAAPVRSPEPPGQDSRLDGSASISPDGHLLAAGLGNGHVYLWNLADPFSPQVLGRLPGSDSGIGAAVDTAFSPDGHLLAASDAGGSVRLWDVSDPAHPIAEPTMSNPTDKTFTPTFSPDGKFLAAGSADRHAYVWDVSTPTHPTLVERLGNFAGYVFSTAFAPTGDVLAAADTAVHLFHVTGAGTSKAAVSRIRIPVLAAGGGINFLAFAPDGHTLAATSQDSDVHVWRVPSGAVLATLAAAGGPVFGATFTPDGDNLLAGSSDRQVHRWTVDTGLATKQLCSRIGARLTTTEWQQYLPGTTYDPPCS